MAPLKMPIPCPSHWELRLKVIPLSLPPPQNCMNLPPDKVQLLSQYDNEKKWELICDQVGPRPLLAAGYIALARLGLAGAGALPHCPWGQDPAQRPA